MEKTIKANKDNDRKIMDGIITNPPNDESELKQESSGNQDENLEYFHE